MKKIIVPVLLAAVISLSFTSCGSTPKAEAPATDLSDKVNEVAEQVEETVKTADNTAALEKTEAARQAAIACGADKLAADQFNAADTLYNALKTQAESGIDISIGLEDVAKRYAALAAYAQALEAKKKIDEKELASYDQDSYDAGCTALSDFENLNSSTNLLGTLMLDKADMAKGKFINVLNKAYKQLAKQARADAFNSKKNADAVKAAVAAKADYSKAAEEFKAGDTNYAMQNAESAYYHYLDSTEKFNKIAESVAAKRAAAQQAIDEAKAKVLASENYAVKADQVNPLEGDNIEGIEAEDAVLLEEDKYEAPETQEADIPEEIKDFEVEEFEGNDSSLQGLINDAVESLESISSSEGK